MGTLWVGRRVTAAWGHRPDPRHQAGKSPAPASAFNSPSFPTGKPQVPSFSPSKGWEKPGKCEWQLLLAWFSRVPSSGSGDEAPLHPGRGSLGTRAAGRAGKVLPGHVCSFMAPEGTVLIISPRNLINLHSVMNLEISIKNIITNQDRIQSSQGLLIALQWQKFGLVCSHL